ncbi:2-oxo acid dehydrogenase subunit E2 [Methylocystis parvus]|uniref:2-oxo acid dehydrogenase subunit E2 n=1 Tax=Methylocystis parvus TaxID=134 RepID=A0A6B8M831_9HYPH|nr:2-oxo acid dehydrogenase subunit E2 [Methylocystis parvus]QGM98728.1 2-oxo acid dehydrogenase subunit E2 [Methylocystis parvus]WBK00922.1 2-oxo acid dehydrogenase subunit E2 [Methylocystis parvus OBBP]
MALVTSDTGAPRIFASPLARRLAKEAGLDLASLNGSGPHGRVIERDVKSALASGAAGKSAPTPARPSAALAETPSTATTRKFYEIDSYEEVPHDSMRKAIARRLTESIQTVPHFYLDVDCEIDALLKLREDFNAAAPKRADGAPEWKTSVNDYIVKALALALQRVPEANVTFTPEAMLKHKASDVGVAVSIPGGLITPIIRNAQAKTVREISDEIKELAGRARARKLKPHEYEGGVSAVSNLGMYGIRNFSAVINPPQSTILAVGKGEQRMVVKDDKPAVATMMTVTLSCDHRAVDGALGAELLAAFKGLIEQPMALFA